MGPFGRGKIRVALSESERGTSRRPGRVPKGRKRTGGDIAHQAPFSLLYRRKRGGGEKKLARLKCGKGRGKRMEGSSSLPTSNREGKKRKKEKERKEEENIDIPPTRKGEGRALSRPNDS